MCGPPAYDEEQRAHRDHGRLVPRSLELAVIGPGLLVEVVAEAVGQGLGSGPASTEHNLAYNRLT